MSTICNKIENVEKIIEEMKERQKEDMREIKEAQAEFREAIEQLTLTNAKYPAPQEVKEAMDKVKRFETFFAIGGVVMVAVWGFILWLIDKWIALKGALN